MANVFCAFVAVSALCASMLLAGSQPQSGPPRSVPAPSSVPVPAVPAPASPAVIPPQKPASDKPALQEPGTEEQESDERARLDAEEQRTDIVARAVSLPSTRAGQQMNWVLGVLNGADAGVIEERCAPEFLEFISAQELKDTLKEIHGDVFHRGRVVPVTIEQGGRDDNISIVIGIENAMPATRAFLSAVLFIDDKTGKITGLRFSPTANPGQSQSSGGGSKDWDEVENGMGGLGGDVAYGAYELVERRFPPGADAVPPMGEETAINAGHKYELIVVAGHDEQRGLAIGSAFKLYVLGQLVEDVQAGKTKWQDTLAIRSDWKSLPSGQMQMEDAGTEFSLQHFASMMISISDNTAADHLLLHLGRERIEQFTARFNDNGGRNEPFLTSREMFSIKLTENVSAREAFASAPTAIRRSMLADMSQFIAHGELPSLDRAGEWADPILIDSIEWFASPRQLCEIMTHLHVQEQATGCEPLGEILRQNPGLSFDNRVWKSVAFKGGSEPGVICCTWLLQRDDAKWYVFAAVWNNTTRAVNNNEFIKVCEGVVNLLEKDGREGSAPRKEQPQPSKPSDTDGLHPPAKVNPMNPADVIPSRRRT